MVFISRISMLSSYSFKFSVTFFDLALQFLKYFILNPVSNNVIILITYWSLCLDFPLGFWSHLFPSHAWLFLMDWEHHS